MVETTLAEPAEGASAFNEFFEALERRLESFGEVGRKIKALKRRSNARALLGIAIDWAIVVGAVAAGEHLGTRWAYLLAVIVIATRINAFSFTWVHEAIHGNLFARKSWNDALDFLYGLPVFKPVAIARRLHMAHHRDYVDESRSPNFGYDYWGIDETNSSDRGHLLWIWWLRPLTGYYTWKFLRMRLGDLLTSVQGAVRFLVFWAVVVGVFYWFEALHLLLYWFVPLLVVHPVLFFWHDMAQHFNVMKSPTRDVRGLFYRLMVCPHGSGAYHNLHHLHATIPWFNLRCASELLIDDPSVDIAHGFFDLSMQIASVRREARRP